MSGIIWPPPPPTREDCKPLCDWKSDMLEQQVHSLGTVSYELRIEEQKMFTELLYSIIGLAVGVVCLGIVTLVMLLYFIANQL